MPAARKSVSGLKAHIGFWMRFVSNHVSHRFAARLLGSGVTVAEWVVLREIYETGTTAPSTLANLTGLSRGAVSKLVDRLRDKKLVTRVEAADDRRFQQVGLSAAGHSLVPKLAAIADRNDEEFFSQLSADERKRLVATLKKLVQVNKLSKLPID